LKHYPVLGIIGARQTGKTPPGSSLVRQPCALLTRAKANPTNHLLLLIFQK